MFNIHVVFASLRLRSLCMCLSSSFSHFCIFASRSPIDISLLGGGFTSTSTFIATMIFHGLYILHFIIFLLWDRKTDRVLRAIRIKHLVALFLSQKFAEHQKVRTYFLLLGCCASDEFFAGHTLPRSFHSERRGFGCTRSPPGPATARTRSSASRAAAVNSDTVVGRRIDQCSCTSLQRSGSVPSVCAQSDCSSQRAQLVCQEDDNSLGHVEV